MEYKHSVLLLTGILTLSAFDYVCAITTVQRVEILEQKIRTQAMEFLLWQQELDALKNMTRYMQTSITDLSEQRGTSHVEQPDKTVTIADDEQEVHSSQLYQVMKALKYEKIARVATEERINTVNNLYRHTKQELKEIKADTALLIGDKEKLKEELQTETKEQFSKLETMMKTGLMEIKDSVTEVRSKVDSNTVAFSALGMSCNVSLMEKIPFTALNNYGKAFSDTTGIFTAPRSGLYIFHVHIYSSPRTMALILMIHGVNSFATYGQRSTDIHNNGGSDGYNAHMYPLILLEGDQVYAVRFGGGTVRSCWINFAGFLLHPL